MYIPFLQKLWAYILFLFIGDFLLFFVVVAVLVGFRVLEWSSANLCCAYVSRICMFNLNILDFFLGLEISTGLLILIIYILYMVGNASFLNTF